MGKFKKKRVDGVKPRRNVPLADQLFEEKSVRPSGREKQRRRREEDDNVCNSYYRPYITSSSHYLNLNLNLKRHY